MTRIFLIEDDDALRSELAKLLSLQGYEVESTVDFPRAAQQALQAAPDCVLLDLRLPGADGHQICRDLRAASAVPILMLTSSESEFDKVMALGLGADDFISKPYRPATLLARIQGLLRRSAQGAPALPGFNGLTLDPSTATACYRGKSVELTRNEVRILGELLAQGGKVVTRQQLMCALWESDAFVDDNTLTVNVNRLRRQLQAIGVPEDFLKTRRGIGYSL